MKLSGLALTAAGALLLGVGFSTPTLATDGATAAQRCTDLGSSCKWNRGDDGSVQVFVADYWIVCGSPQAECEFQIKNNEKEQTLDGQTVESVLGIN